MQWSVSHQRIFVQTLGCLWPMANRNQSRHQSHFSGAWSCQDSALSEVPHVMLCEKPSGELALHDEEDVPPARECCEALALVPDLYNQHEEFDLATRPACFAKSTQENIRFPSTTNLLTSWDLQVGYLSLPQSQIGLIVQKQCCQKLVIVKRSIWSRGMMRCFGSPLSSLWRVRNSKSLRCCFNK